MKTLKYILIIVFTSQFIFISVGQNKSDLNMRSVSKSVDSTLSLYGKYSTFSQNGRNFSSSYADKFKDLFVSPKSIVVSDLDIKGVGDEIPVGNYVRKAEKSYPKGIGVRISNISKEKPIKTKHGYIIHVWFNKEIFGFRNKQKIERNPRMCMVISFYKKGKYKIVSVLDERKQNIQDNTTSTIEFGLNLLPGYSYLSIKNNILEGFSSNGGMSFSGEIYGAKYFKLKPNTYYGIGMGIGYSTFSGDVGFSSYSQTQDTIAVVDIDDWEYLYNVEFEDTKENITFNTINFTLYPVRIRLTNILNNFELFINGGVKFYIPSGASTTVTGKAHTAGYYPDHSNLLLNDVSIYGFENRDIENGELTLNSMAYSGIVNIGLALPFGRHLIVKAGLQLEVGISSLTEYNPLLITRENKSSENYYHSILNTTEKAKLNTTNFLIGIAYRL